jgi:hypothetical protein
MDTRRYLVLIAACGLAACAALTPGYANQALGDLFNSERAFARMAAQRGIAPAFDQYLAADAIVFRPGPVVYPRTQAAANAVRDPAAPLLEWAPQAGAVSRANDLGYTTGPYRLVKQGERQPLDQGYFFSVWKRVDGVWRVAIDAGVATVAPTPQEGLANFLKPIEANPPAQPTAQQLQTARDELLVREQSPRSLAALPPEGTASFYEWITPSTRWLRTGPSAVFGATIRDELTNLGGRIEWAPLAATVAQSNDLAYTYGRFTRTAGTGSVTTGYYVHVWQRNDQREWRLAAIVWLPPG